MREGPIPKKGPLVLVLFSSQFYEKKDQEKKNIGENPGDKLGEKKKTLKK